LLEFSLHPVQEVGLCRRHQVETEQTCIVVQEHPDPAGRRAAGNLHRLLLVAMADGEGGEAALKTPRERVVSQPALIR